MQLYLRKKLVINPLLNFKETNSLIEKNNQFTKIFNSLRNFYLIYLGIPFIIISFFYFLGFPFLLIEDLFIKTIFPNKTADFWNFTIQIFDYLILVLILILFLFLPSIKIIFVQKTIVLLKNMQRKMIAQEYVDDKNILKINSYFKYFYKEQSSLQTINNFWTIYWYICLIPILPNFSRIWISSELKINLFKHLQLIINQQNIKLI